MGFFQNAGNWIKNAAIDVGDWTKQAAIDTGDWFKDGPVGSIFNNALGAATGENQANIQQQERDAAQQQQEFSQNSADKAMEFSAGEAQKLRDWQTEMSNTAIQRSTADMKAAGINPILAAGSQASTPGGGMGGGAAAAGDKASVSAENQLMAILGVYGQLANTALKAASSG